MFGFPSLYGFNAKAQPQVLVNKFGMKGNNMTNCPGGWLTEQKECCSSEEVWANLLQSLKLFIWERNPAKKGKCISEIYCFEGKHMQLKFMTLLVWGSPKVLNNEHNVMIKEAILLACKSIVKIFIFVSSISKLFSPLSWQPCCFHNKLFTVMILTKAAVSFNLRNCLTTAKLTSWQCILQHR